MKFRLPVLKFALLASFLFILFRLLYKIIFGGTSTPGIALPSLPAIKLPEPFDHIQLFGPVTVEGLFQTFILALPFSTVIFGFGLLASMIDPLKIQQFAHQRKFPALLRTLGIAVSSIPSLLSSASAVRRHNLLRGNKRITSYLVPILEQSLERALALAANLELSTRQPIEPIRELPIRLRGLQVDKLEFGDLEISRPGIYVFTGPNGSGKSTLMRTLTGLGTQFDNRSTHGLVEIFGFDPTVTELGKLASIVSYVPQNPRLGILSETLSEEAKFRGVGPSSRFGEERTLASLSEGEIRILAIDLALKSEPKILVLDEPFASLDEFEHQSLISLIEQESRRRVVVIAVPDALDLQIPKSKVFQLTDSGIKVGSFQAQLNPDSSIYPEPGSKVAIAFDSIEATVAGRALFQNLAFSATEFSITAITGRNGVGKSTLLSKLSGQESRLVPESFRDFFVTDSLQSELEYSDKVAKQVSGFTSSLFFSIMNGANQNIVSLLETHPRDLSDGTQFGLAIAIQLAHKPKAVLIDEPTRGFDMLARDSVARVLKCVAETGTAVIFATHDKKLMQIAHKVFELRDQVLVEVTVANPQI